MRALGKTLVGLMAATLVAGCGSLDNNPLRTGIVRGRAVGTTVTSTSLALVQERTQLRTPLAEDGAFELREVPAGEIGLYVVASSDAAALLKVKVPGGQVLDLGDIQMGTAARITVQVSVEHGLSAAGALVTLEGTPFENVALGAGDQVVLAPVPAGCYEVEAVIPNVGSEDADVCVTAGQDRLVVIEVGPDGSASCGDLGCLEGLVCAADGRCVECNVTTDCASGLECQGNLCVGQLPACGVCTEDRHCGVSGECRSGSGGIRYCEYPCVNATCPERGFACDADNRCVPAPSSFEGCDGMAQLDASCDGDQRCRDQGLVNGVCVELTCTIPCGDDSQCPVNYVCGSRGGQAVCVRG